MTTIMLCGGIVVPVYFAVQTANVRTLCAYMCVHIVGILCAQCTRCVYKIPVVAISVLSAVRHIVAETVSAQQEQLFIVVLSIKITIVIK